MADVTIRQETIDWNGPEESGVELFIYASKPLVNSVGVPVNASNPWEDRMRDRPWRKVGCTINTPTATLTIDALTVSDTEDAIVGSDTTLVAVFMDTSYAIPRFICKFSVFGEGFTLPSEPSYTTWAQIAARMAGVPVDVDESNLPILIHDKFSSGTSNANRRPTFTRVGTLWQEGAGEVEITGGYAAFESGYPDGAHQLIETNRSNLTFAALVTGYHGVSAGTQGIPGLIFRAEDDENNHVVNMDTSNVVTTAYEQTAGVFDDKATIGTAQASGAPIPLSITAVDDLINIHLAGQAPVQYTSEAFMEATLVGIRAGKFSGGTPAGQPRFDDVAVLPAFERVGTDPIIETVAATWEDGLVAAPSVFYDPELAKYVMAYSGFGTSDDKWRVGLAYADSPEGPFTKEVSNPVFEPEVGDGYIAASCSVVCDASGVWWMAFQVAPNATAGDPDLPWLVCLAKSTDKGLTWERLNDGDTLPLGAAGSFYETGMHDPDLRIRDDNKFEIAFSGRDADGIFTAGHIIADDLETVGAASQFTILGQFGAGMGTNGILNVAFGSNDRLKYSMYFCHDFAGKRFIARSDTENGGTTWKYWGGVFFKRGSGWESEQVFDPALFQEGDKLYLYYTAADVSGGTEPDGAQIGVAVLDLSPPSPSSFSSSPGQGPEFHF